MDDVAIQRTRAQLQSRVRRLKTGPVALFPSACRQFLAWVEGHALLRAVRATLAAEVAAAREKLAPATVEDRRRHRDGSGIIEAATLNEATALGLATLEVVAEMAALDPSQDRYIGPGAHPVINLARVLAGNNGKLTTEDAVECIRDTAVETVYDFLDEALDSRNTALV